MSLSAAFLSSPSPFLSPKPLSTKSPKPKLHRVFSFSDPLISDLTQTLTQNPTHPNLQSLRDTSSQSLISRSWPTNKDEPFRFTNTSFLTSLPLTPIPTPTTAPTFPPTVFVGPATSLPSSHASLSLLGFGRGDLFADINGVAADDVTVIHVPAGVRASDEPIHLRFCYGGGGEGGMGLASPRILVVVEKGAEVGIVEEHVGEGEGERCWSNSVVEIAIEEGGTVRHSYVQSMARESAHTKWTFVRQEASSNYEFTEICTGGRLSRHSLQIEQLGPDTVTEISSFHVSQNNQIQDLHSNIILDHPRGYCRQLHKCVVSHSSGNAVFVGNVKVNRLAQQTDAGQLARTILLAPNVTVNMKPSLQIIADDVKCSHGVAISDLEKDQLLYFRSRGIDERTARNALLYAFGAEIVSRIPFSKFRKSTSSHIQQVLDYKKTSSV